MSLFGFLNLESLEVDGNIYLQGLHTNTIIANTITSGLINIPLAVSSNLDMNQRCIVNANCIVTNRLIVGNISGFSPITVNDDTVFTGNVAVLGEVVGGNLIGTTTTNTLTNKTLTSNTCNVTARALWSGTGTNTISVYDASDPSEDQVLTATASTTAIWKYPSLAGGTAVNVGQTNDENNIFTGIPSWARRITLVFLNMRLTDNSAHILIQLGTSSGISTSSYFSVSETVVTSSSGFIIYNANSTSPNQYQLSGRFVIDYTEAPFIYIGTHTCARTDFTCPRGSGNSQGLPGLLDRVNVTTTVMGAKYENGTATIYWE